MNFSYIAKLAGVATALPLLPTTLTAQEREQKPNVILIMTDQQRFDALGCVNDAVISPNLDELAHQGYLFTSAYSSTPSSTPARAGLITGMSPWNHGLLGYALQATKYQFTMPQMLSDVGYNTIGIGKMHFNPQRNTHGFDLVINDESGRVQDEYFVSDYRKWFYSQALGENPDKTGVNWNSHMARTYALEERLHPTQWTGDVAVDAIEGYHSEKPLLMKISFARPHSPYDPPQRVLELYSEKEAPAPVVGDWTPKEWAEFTDPSYNSDAAIGAFGDEYTKNSRRHYYASVTFVDEQVGRIVEALKANGMYDNSLIIFISDHGDMLGDHNLWRKTYAYEGSAAVPYIIKLPSSVDSVIAAGGEIDLPVELRDLLPTMLDLCNIEQPAQMDGLSLMPLFEQSAPQWRDYIDLEHARAYFDENYWMALTDGKIKYIWSRSTGEEQLFDLRRDAYETHNLIDDEEYRATLKSMRARMVEHLEVRGEEWVESGELKVSSKVQLYSKNFPEKR
ncbi:MAG: arylsulfatase [Rikenellaceae bacterium]